MKHTLILLLSLIISSQAIAQPVTNVSFYVVAHQDQWQLFMGLNAYNDISAGKAHKVVFIYVTAGDSSCGGTALRPFFYHARQAGANNSVEFCADQYGLHDTTQCTYVTRRTHYILRYKYKNVTSYCLALPDGCNSTGLNGQSLQRLYDHLYSPIAAVDSSAEYTGWADLTNTIKNIIDSESAGIANVALYTADTSAAINPGDNPDHIYAAVAALDAAGPLVNIKEFVFSEYCTAALPANLSDADLATKSALLSILDYGRTSNSQSSEWAPAQVIYAGRNYMRQVR